jgi:hypothetical protein
MMSNEAFFGDCKKVDQNFYDNRPAVIINNLSITTANKFKVELGENGIIAWSEIKSSSNKIKAFCDTEQIKTKLLQENFIINNFKFYVEKIERRAKQCSNCNKLGHYVNECQLKNALCARCSEEKHDGNCSREFKCTNCGEAHSAFYKGCRALKSDKENNSADFTNQKSFSNNLSKISNEDTHRNYSSYKTVVTKESTLLEKILKQNEQLLKNQEENKIEMNLKLDNLVTRQTLDDAIQTEAKNTKNNIEASVLLTLDIMKQTFIECMNENDRNKLVTSLEKNILNKGLNRTLIEERAKTQRKRDRSSSQESNEENYSKTKKP